MNRRNILKLTLGLGVLGLFTNLLKVLPQGSSRIDVVFHLPENMSLEKFRQSVHLWVDAGKLEGIQTRYQRDGRILAIQKNNLNSQTLINTFHFSNDEALESFIRDLGSQCNYNFEARAKLGIQTTSYINGQLRNFYQLPAFKG